MNIRGFETPRTSGIRTTHSDQNLGVARQNGVRASAFLSDVRDLYGSALSNQVVGERTDLKVRRVARTENIDSSEVQELDNFRANDEDANFDRFS